MNIFSQKFKLNIIKKTNILAFETRWLIQNDNF